jgi:malate dehydrogenase
MSLSGVNIKYILINLSFLSISFLSLGNHSATQFPDVANGTVNGKPIYDVVADNAYLEGSFIETVQKRGAAVISARKMSSAMSAAKAAADHVHDWWHGTQAGKFIQN